MNPPKDEAHKLWRTLVRVKDRDECGVLLTVYGWNVHQPVFVYWDQIPDTWQEHLRTMDVVLCLVNIGVEDLEDLVFTGWEVAPEPDSMDGLA